MPIPHLAPPAIAPVDAQGRAGTNPCWLAVCAPSAALAHLRARYPSPFPRRDPNQSARPAPSRGSAVPHLRALGRALVIVKKRVMLLTPAGAQ